MLEVRIRKKMGSFILNVDFCGEGRSRIGILGASGSGKSMTLKCIAGITRPDEGRIIMNGKVLYDSEKKINLPPQKRSVGYLFQNYALFPNMSVEKNIKIGIKGRRNKKEIQKAADLLIQRVHLEGLEERYPYELSGGQQQRAALARILANEPDIIMLDEPFSALDSFLKEELQSEIADILKDYDGNSIMVSHNRDEIYKLTDSLAIMDAGNIIKYDQTKQIFLNPEFIEAAKLTGCKNISRAVKKGEYQIYAADWNIVLHTDQKASDSVSYIGIRAHHIRILENQIKSNITNIMTMNVIQVQELPFDFHYIVQNTGQSAQPLIIKRPKAALSGSDPYQDIINIELPPDKLLLLQ